MFFKLPLVVLQCDSLGKSIFCCRFVLSFQLLKFVSYLSKFVSQESWEMLEVMLCLHVIES